MLLHNIFFVAILGLIPRDCPLEPFGELWFDVQPCETDAECWPRICCPDGAQRYCRTAVPRFDLVPGTRNFNSRKPSRFD